MRKQYGFGALEGLLMLVIVGILGFTGWYVWHSTKNANSSYGNVSNTVVSTKPPATKTPATTKTDSYAGWKTYNDSSYGVSFKYPGNWSVDASVVSGLLNINVSQVTSEQITAHQSSLSKYNDFMEVSFIVSKTNIGGGGSGGENVLEYLTFNGVKYPLIGDTYNGKVAQALLMNCASKTNCTDWVPMSNGGSIDARIASVANRQAATIPMDLQSSQYKTAHLVLSSLRI